MITEISIERFKGFVRQRFPFARLTVLTGTNSAGKSSLIQTILLARQAAAADVGAAIELNGPYNLNLGEAVDVLNHNFESHDGVTLEVKEGGSSARVEFGIPGERSQRLKIESKESFEGFSLAQGERYFSYLCAERIGPRHVFQATSMSAADLSVGATGESVAQVLAQFDNQPVEAALVHPGTKAANMRRNLRDQAELWMSSIACPINIEAEWIANTNVTVLRFRKPGFISEWVRPSNTGFGLTHTLPVIVAGLVAKPGGLLIIENPETHLHPRGQSAIGAFLAKVCQAGVQVVVETHSDHVINGIRRAVGVEAILPSDDVLIHFFDQAGSDGSAAEEEVDPDLEALTNQKPCSRQIRVLGNGELSEWPKLFFDQIDADLRQLAKARKK